MSSPLLPLNSPQLKSRTPVSSTRSEKMDATSKIGTPFTSATPSKQTEQEEVIDWDEGASSPFVSETPDARAVSQTHKQPIVVDSEIDAIFEDPVEVEEQPADNKASDFSFSTISNKENTVFFDSPSRPPIFTSGGEDDKENVGTPETAKKSSAMTFDLEHDKENNKKGTPEQTKRPLSPVKPKSTIKKRPSSSREDDFAMAPPSTRKSLRFHSPVKTSPVKTLDFASETPLPKSRDASFEKAEEAVDSSIVMNDLENTSAGIDETNVDDTCFSTFSAVPDMTLFARLGESRRNSPAKKSRPQTPQTIEQRTPRTTRKFDTTSRSPSPTPRRPKTPGTRDTTSTYLIDFTQQIEHFADPSRRPHNIDQTPSRRSPQKSSTEPNLLSYLNKQRSPAKNPRLSTPAKATSLMNLLDFELPPAPTPRSIPTITVRELESMKSTYQSQISSLKATLSGREAEVESLKKAVGDAERRVGEALEKLREERGQREQAEHEKSEWEKRGADFENLLKNVREEVLNSEVEKEELIRQTEESQRHSEKYLRRADEAETKVIDLEAQLATARAAIPKGDGSGGIDEAEISRLVQQQVDAKIEAVSRELHSVYKKKHETKVATLKKSYEARGEKKCIELQARLDELAKQNEELSSANNNVDSSVMFSAEDRKQIDEHKSTIEEQRAALARLSKELHVMRSEQGDLLRELEKERIEKGELVAACDEMLALQSTEGSSSAAVEDFKRSIRGPPVDRPAPYSALPATFRQPAPAAESRIGRSTGMPRPSGIASKSRMMNNIERMGGAPKH